MMNEREEDIKALEDARRWLRWLYTEGSHRASLDAIKADVVYDVVLRLEKFVERFKEGKCSV